MKRSVFAIAAISVASVAAVAVAQSKDEYELGLTAIQGCKGFTEEKNTACDFGFGKDKLRVSRPDIIKAGTSIVVDHDFMNKDDDDAKMTLRIVITDCGKDSRIETGLRTKMGHFAATKGEKTWQKDLTKEVARDMRNAYATWFAGTEACKAPAKK